MQVSDGTVQPEATLVNVPAAPVAAYPDQFMLVAWVTPVVLVDGVALGVADGVTLGLVVGVAVDVGVDVAVGVLVAVLVAVPVVDGLVAGVAGVVLAVGVTLVVGEALAVGVTLALGVAVALGVGVPPCPPPWPWCRWRCQYEYHSACQCRYQDHHCALLSQRRRSIFLLALRCRAAGLFTITFWPGALIIR